MHREDVNYLYHPTKHLLANFFSCRSTIIIIILLPSLVTQVPWGGRTKLHIIIIRVQQAVRLNYIVYIVTFILSHRILYYADTPIIILYIIKYNNNLRKRMMTFDLYR